MSPFYNQNGSFKEKTTVSKLPLVSIGMPVYNGAKYIRRALDSLLAQAYDKYEIIISDNASTDETPKILKEYASLYPCIRIYTHPENVGVQENFMTVLELARGEYFMWAADDDYWLPSFVPVLVNELNNHPDSGVAMCAVESVRADGALHRTVRFSGKDDPNSKNFLKMALALASPLKYNLYFYGLFRRELLLSAIQLLPGIPASDRWLILLISLVSRFRYVDDILHIRTIHAEPYQERYPADQLVRNQIAYEQKWFDFAPIPVIARMICQSAIIPGQRKLYLLIILPYFTYKRTRRGLRRMRRSFKRSILGLWGGV
jgi:glycosyltransferase involved in cell wall biosynthesis